MRYVFIEREKASSIENFHIYLMDLFEFPNYYGGNLDSLYDCLTSISECIAVTMPSGFAEILDGYGRRIIKVFTDAADYNDYLQLYIEGENN